MGLYNGIGFEGLDAFLKNPSFETCFEKLTEDDLLEMFNGVQRVRHDIITLFQESKADASVMKIALSAVEAMNNGSSLTQEQADLILGRLNWHNFPSGLDISGLEFNFTVDFTGGFFGGSLKASGTKFKRGLRRDKAVFSSGLDLSDVYIGEESVDDTISQARLAKLPSARDRAPHF